MSQPQKKSWLASLSPTRRTALGIIIIAIVVVLGVKYGPHYPDSDTTTGDALPPTITVTGQSGSLNVNRSLVYRGVTVTVTNVQQAQSFSDDGKSSYAQVKYVVRVSLHTQAPANQQGALGIEYCALSHLVLADGSELPCKLAQISPDVLPGQVQDGFIDFWINTPPLQLSTLKYMLNNDAIAFDMKSV
jgi:hypothetical protein